MATLFLNHRRHFQRRLRTPADFPVHFQVGTYFVMFSLLALIGLLSFFYLQKFTNTHTKGYQLRRLEMAKQQLDLARERSSVAIAKEKSLASVRETAVALSMVQPRSEVYIKVDGAIAQAPLVPTRP
ncbi:hypothetical protein KBD59_05715 [Candidatus Gracilibacteria bacterium]|nr:hypothetical protein [Candidatus Gracilibacteria bacterium]